MLFDGAPSTTVHVGVAPVFTDAVRMSVDPASAHVPPAAPSIPLPVSFGLDVETQKKIDEESARNGGFFSASLLFPPFAATAGAVHDKGGPSMASTNAGVANPTVPSTVLPGGSALDDAEDEVNDTSIPARTTFPGVDPPEWNFESPFDTPDDAAHDVSPHGCPPTAPTEDASPSAPADEPDAECSSLIKIIEPQDALPVSYSIPTVPGKIHLLFQQVSIFILIFHMCMVTIAYNAW